ncbi:conjugal transfer protein [Streptococcus dentiloxodontae]
MLLHKIYEGITCFPEKNEFWNLYIVLMKGKDYFYDCFARQIQDNGECRNYQHAYFTTDGQILDLNQRMTTDLALIFRQVITDKQTIFTEEILMAEQTQIEKKIKALSTELGELLKTHNTNEAWTKAGELNHLLKSEEAQQLPPLLLEVLQAELRSYYYVNGELNRLHKQLYAKGSKLIELANA